MVSKNRDALGQPLVEDALYFVEDRRQRVGNQPEWFALGRRLREEFLPTAEKKGRP